MLKEKSTKIRRFRGVFAGFLMLIGIISGSFQTILGGANVYASPITEDDSALVAVDPVPTTTESLTPDPMSNTEYQSMTQDEQIDNSGNDDTVNQTEEEDGSTDNDSDDTSSNSSSTDNEESGKKKTTDSCKKSMGSLGWIVCPLLNKVSEAVDWLYDKIEDILMISPIKPEDGSPIYEIWKYCLGVTNVVFIIFLLIVIYSQITGWGINNYGIKKALPKLIVMAILVNLSFLICSLAVDVSNIIGNGIRGIFTAVEETALSNMGSNVSSTAMAVSVAETYTSMAAGSALAIGAGALLIAFEPGVIWMMIPTVLGAIVAVATGLITIALRQAVVILLVMIAPLAFVANILPNTESLFQKWKRLLMRMLVFYPMFSLLFGASSLAGFAIIMSAHDGFMLLLGIAVQIFPLFFSWKLMQMSGTFLGDINARLRALGSKPVEASRSFATARKQFAKQKKLASTRPIMPSTRLMQFMSNRRIAREEEMSEMAETVKLRGQSYAAKRNYKNNGRGVPTREGEEAYARQAENMRYMGMIERHKNNMNKGFGMLSAVELEASTAQKARLKKLDLANVTAADDLKIEKARGEKIEYENAKGFHNRMERAINTHFDDANIGNTEYKRHEMKPEDRALARAQYSSMNNIMEGDLQGIHYAAATAAQGYDSQKKIVETKMQKYFDLTPPTKDVEYRLGELTTDVNAIKNIDSIISGFRILSQRGDTDILKEQMDNLLSHNVQLGSHASQALASFLMFDVKDSDPWLRRFGKYINLETARVYNKNDRQVMNVTYDEYIKGYHDGEPITISNPTGRMYAKKSMKELMEGTSIDSIERTALSNYDDSLIKAFTDKNGKLDYDSYIKRREEIDTAFAPAFISASLKYLSGSEQIASAVRAKTGYGTKQLEDGTYVNEPIWENKKYKKIFAGHEKDLQEWYQDKTLRYLLDQTPSQILGLRSDYKTPLADHLSNAYMESDMKGWSEDAIAERNEIMREWSELQTKYGDKPTGEAKARYEIESKALKEKMIGAQFRQLLDSKGKLNQIYRTRRSGAANSAKDWVRDWLDLDNEALINMKLNNDRDKMNKELKKMARTKNNSTDADASSDGGTPRVYSDADISMFTNYVDDLWNDLKDEDEARFFDESYKYLKNELGKDSFIVHAYKHIHDNDPALEPYDLKNSLMDLLVDPGNY